MANPYQKLELRQYPAIAARQTAENRFWSSFRFPILTKQYGAVTNIDFSSVDPYDFAVTSSTRVQIYSSKTNEVKKTISRFKDVAYSATIRSDGTLMVAGGERPIVQVFELSTRSVLRSFRGHKGAVRKTVFASDKTKVISGSDDTTGRVWDVGTGSCIALLTEHSDYIRAIGKSNAQPQLFCTGSYDHTVKLWDPRSLGAEGGEQSVMSLDHGAPIESVVMFPSGGTLVSAGGNELKVWDIYAGGKLLHTFSNHQKAITQVFFNGDYTRLLSAGLDHQLKVYDVKTYNVVHSLSYPAPILAAALSSNSSHLVVGMADGLLSVRHRVQKQKDDLVFEAPKRQPAGGTYPYFVRGQNRPAHSDDHRVEATRRQKLREFDHLLRKFRHREALQCVVEQRDPVVFVSLCAELMHRNTLKNAISGRSAVELEPLLRLVLKNLINPRYSSVLLHVANLLLDVYGEVLGQSVEIDQLFIDMAEKVQAEVAVQKELMSLAGAADIVVNAAHLGVMQREEDSDAESQ